MKKKFFVIVFMVGCCLIAVPEAFAGFRCGGKVIDMKITQEELLANCGPPTETKKKTREIKIKNCASERIYDTKRTMEEKRDDPCVKITDIEEWFYNFGPTEYTYTLIFEDGKLVTIERGGHGR